MFPLVAEKTEERGGSVDIFVTVAAFCVVIWEN
jgi:hypothetical protein